MRVGTGIFVLTYQVENQRFGGGVSKWVFSDILGWLTGGVGGRSSIEAARLKGLR